ncbi:protein piccolo-like [Lytechinus variegatus]|uniref:protein piccolo-like n=1 Tax=Lytechinus variegatus TaxID=7654 RepID=UPI001BB22CAB|nr:protein piccolo-like [Lytechinus variegatus]XP_041466487.1 protein piccolo-like [Lytechinus variegatus]
MNGAGVVTPPPKPAPKPLAKPKLPRRSTSDAILVPTVKPTTSPKPPPPVAQKPKPSQPPVTSPKPSAAISTRPNPRTSPGTTPVVTNGGIPPPVASKPKPKPLVKSKTWIASPQQSLDLEESSKTSEAISERNSTTNTSGDPVSEAAVSKAASGIPPKDETEKAESDNVPEKNIDNISIPVEERKDIPAGADQSIQFTSEVLRNSNAASLQSHVTEEPQHCENSQSNSIDSTAADPSNLPINVSDIFEDSSQFPSPHYNDGIKNDSSSADSSLETADIPKAQPSESSGVADRELGAVQDSTCNANASSEITANSVPTSDVEQESSSTDPASRHDDDDDDAFVESGASSGKDEPIKLPKPPVPAPRKSLSSVNSEASSIDSYDLLNTGSSFKSHRSSNSVRSQGSSRLGSDSEDECGVFEIQPDIPEEDEEAEEARLHKHSTGPDDEDHLKEQNNRFSVFADLQEREGHIAENNEDIVLVSLKAGVQDKSEIENEIEAKHSDQIVSDNGNNISQECNEEQSASNSVVVVGQVEDPVASEKDKDTTENTEDPLKVQVDVDVTKVDEHVGLTAQDIPVSYPEELEVREPEGISEIEEVKTQENQTHQKREEVEGSLGRELSSGGENSEEEFDEMGKRVFSLSRKKKPGVLKYSSGEFHEQYEGAGQEKSVPENSKSKDHKKKPKKDQKKGKKEVTEENNVIEDVHDESAAACKEELGASSDEDRPSKPPRMRPGATPEELEVGRASTTSDVSTGPLEGEDTVRPMPSPRVSLPVPSRPKISLSHRVGSLSSQSDDDQNTSIINDDEEAAIDATSDSFREDHTVNGVGAGAIVTRVDSDGEEEVFIGGMPSTSMCTQTAFADQASLTSSADGSQEVRTLQQGNNDQQFRHFATIEPVGDAAQKKESPSADVLADSSTLMSGPTDTLTTLSENQSITISITESEPLSDSTEFLSQPSEHALNKPWSEVAAVTVAVTTMPEPLVPEFTRVEGDSSTTSSSSSLVPCQPSAQENTSLDSSQDDCEEDDEDDDDDDTRNMYDKIDIYDESYKKKDWKYRETEKEIRMITQPDPENDDEAAEAKDTVSHLSQSSLATTASEQEYKSSFGERPHRIQRRKGSEDFVRLSRISRERTIQLHRQDGTYGLRIQKSKPVVITNLDPGGPAEKAGLKIGDMVLKINGQDVRQVRHSEVVKLATEAPEPLVLVVGTMVCHSLNLRSDQTIMSGYMHKLASTGMIKQWRKRWFVLKHDHCLYYYKTEDDILPQGAIVLQNYTVTKARDAGKQFSFKLTKEGARTYVFYTSNEEERSSWGKAINDAANPNHKTDVWLDISTHNVSIPALSIKDPECTGYLTKWNGKMKNPRRRYCVLKDACLYYFKEMNALEAQGVVHLHGYSLQETELKGKKFAFILKPPDEELREFYFFADHDTDRKRWVAALASSIGRWISTNNPEDGDDDGTEMYI